MRSIYITTDNRRRLEQLMNAAPLHYERDREAFRDLQSELDRAVVLTSQAMPPDVVTMHSQARVLDVDTGEEMLFRLVFPDEANVEKGQLSVLAPLGTAILGYRTGDTLTWKVPDGVRRLKILEVVFQPEANGHKAPESG